MTAILISLMNFRMLRSLKSLKHSKVHDVGDESEGLVVILQGMAVDIGYGTELFYPGKCVFNSNSDSPLFLVVDFFRASEFPMSATTLEWDENSKIGVILFNALIAIVNVYAAVPGNHIRKSGFLKKLVIMSSSADRRRNMNNESFSSRCDLGFHSEFPPFS